MYAICKGKFKVHPATHHEDPERRVEIELYPFFNLGARWGGCSTPHPGRFTPGKEYRYPL
jgi:hypothetical protein